MKGQQRYVPLPLPVIYLVRRRSISFSFKIGPRYAMLGRWTKDGQKDVFGCRKLDKTILEK